jgi:hypothetical protein
MSLGEWLEAFRALHERARAGQLLAEEQADYRAGREELARALVAAQRLTLKPGQTPRKALRVARALQVDLETKISHVRATTIDLSLEGFSALLAKAPPAGDEIQCTLRLPGSDPLVTAVKPVDIKVQEGNARVSFAFVGLAEPQQERLEMLLFDTVLAQIGK